MAGASRVTTARGFEIDSHYGLPAQELWQNTPLQLNLGDFTQASPPNQPGDKPNLLICNPPYVRHHHVSKNEKARLQLLTARLTGKRLSGLAGLYCHFLLLTDPWLAEGGISCWLIPNEFLDVNYGDQVKEYLLEQVTLLRIHRFDPENVQFPDALVSSVVVWFRKHTPPNDHLIEFTYGRELNQAEHVHRIARRELHSSSKWTTHFHKSAATSFPHIQRSDSLRLGDIFDIKRGIATGANGFFILSDAQRRLYDLPSNFLKPILPSPRHLETDYVCADEHRLPMLHSRLFLLDCHLTEDIVRQRYTTLHQYYQLGIEQGIDQRYLCRHRSPWYIQEERPPAPILCTYMGRQIAGRGNVPFRFIRNQSCATAANVYLLLYPKPALQKLVDSKPDLLDSIWGQLQQLTPDALIRNGRTYGGKLHKLEPKELANVFIDRGDLLIEPLPQPERHEQMRLLETSRPYLP